MCKPMEPIPMPYKDDCAKVELVEFKIKRPYDWHDELIALLLRKSFLVYITFSELKFHQGDYGTSTKNLKRAFNCYFALSQVGQVGINLARSKNVKVLLAFAQGVAADAYVALVSHWDDLYINFVEKFNDEGSTYDQVIAKEVENYIDESQRKWVLKVTKDIEEALLLALKCFKSALAIYEGLAETFSYDVEDEAENLKGRFGNALNIAGSYYIKRSASMCDQDFNLQDALELLITARHLLTEGLDIFQGLNQDMNCVILTTNLGMSFRTEAYAIKVNNEAELMRDQALIDSIANAFITEDDLDNMNDNDKPNASIKQLVPSSKDEMKSHEYALENYKKAVDFAIKINDQKVIFNALMNFTGALYYALKECWLKDLKAYLKKDQEHEHVMDLLTGKYAQTYAMEFLQTNLATLKAAPNGLKRLQIADRGADIFVNYSFIFFKHFIQIRSMYKERGKSAEILYLSVFMPMLMKTFALYANDRMSGEEGALKALAMHFTSFTMKVRLTRGHKRELKTFDTELLVGFTKAFREYKKKMPSDLNIFLLPKDFKNR